MSLSPQQKHLMEQLHQQHRLRQRQVIQRMGAGYVRKKGKRLLSFSDNDYLGLSFHPQMIEAATRAIAEYGTSAGASRLITGNHPLYQQCEQKLAQLKSTEDAIIFGSGYLANLGVIPALAKSGDFILADKLIHASLIDAITLSGATFKRFAHNDAQHAAQLLQKHRADYDRCILLTEGVFSMDGDIAPVEDLLSLAHAHDCQMVLDDAHGFGILGQGKGLCAALNVQDERLLQIGTFSKAMGSYGGYVCGSAEWMEYLLNTSRSVIYTTGLPPATLAANLAALTIIEHSPELPEAALENARYFTQQMQLPAAQSTIVPLIIGLSEETMQFSHKLEAQGFLVSAIRPPTVPQGKARLRFTFSAMHERADIDRLVEAVHRIEANG